MTRARASGRREALEEAAKIAETHGLASSIYPVVHIARVITDAIRALAEKEKK